MHAVAAVIAECVFDCCDPNCAVKLLHAKNVVYFPPRPTAESPRANRFCSCMAPLYAAAGGGLAVAVGASSSPQSSYRLNKQGVLLVLAGAGTPGAPTVPGWSVRFDGPRGKGVPWLSVRPVIQTTHAGSASRACWERVGSK